MTTLWPPVVHPNEPPTPPPGLHYRVRPYWHRGEWMWAVDQHNSFGWWFCRMFATEAAATSWATQHERAKGE